VYVCTREREREHYACRMCEGVVSHMWMRREMTIEQRRMSHVCVCVRERGWIVSHVFSVVSRMSICRQLEYPHEKLLGIQRVSNLSTENQRISTPAHSNGCKADSNLVWSYWYKSNKRVFTGSKTRIQEASWVQSFVERVLCVCVCVIHITCFNQSCHRCACVKYTRHD